jgi:hypothetical protein
MGDSDAPTPRLLGSRSELIEAFLIELIRAHSPLKFGAICSAALTKRSLPERTVARHLARLVRNGEVTIHPDRTYTLPDPKSPEPRATTESRWMEHVVVLRPDGSAAIFVHQEFRVVSGRITRIEYAHASPLRRFSWWCSVPGLASPIPQALAPSRMSAIAINFATPLTARRSTWEQVCVAEEVPDRFRMAYAGTRRGRTAAPGTPPEWESEWIGYAQQARRLDHRYSKDAYLRLQVLYPQGYPFRRCRFRVRYSTDPDRTDPSEEGRIASLSKDPLHQNGFRAGLSLYVLSIPRPVIDRRYCLEWELPTETRRNQWIRAHRSRGL